MIRYVRLIVLGVVAAGAAGCTMPMTNSEEQAVSPSDRFPITVEPEVVTMSVAIDDGMQRLAPGESDRIRAFAERWKSRGEGMINASAPAGSQNRGAAMASLEEVKRILRSSGVTPRAVSVSSYRAENDPRAPITLSFVTLQATAGECGRDWSQNLASTPRNMPWPDFGCSTQHNFAALVADPRDFIEPRTSAAGDDLRRSQVLDNFRKGMPTQSQKSPDDSGAVSTVAH